MEAEAIRGKRAKLAKRLYANLASWEFLLWPASWIFGVGYSLYHVFLASKRYWRYLHVEDFEPGLFAASRKDVSDAEWAVFSNNFVDMAPWLLLHFIGTQYFQRFHTKMIPFFHLTLSLLYLTRTMTFRPVIFLLAQPIVIFVIAEIFKKSLAVWTMAIIIICCYDQPPISTFKTWALDDVSWSRRYMTHVTLFWINSRCVSFCLDHIWQEVPKEDSIAQKLTQMLAYCFYLPLCIGGPLINYKIYYQGLLQNPPKSWPLSRIKELVLLFIRYFFWYAMVELWLHFFYICAIKLEPELIAKLDSWSLAGMGYGMGQFFMMKYVFFYGITRPFLKADGIDPPDHPKCIGRIHLYSDMWRYFDVGLHKFMHKYLYCPIMSLRKDSILWQLLAGTVCFSFVYLWHGIMPNVMVWSFLNYMGIVIETLGRVIWRAEWYQKIEKRFLGPRGMRRWHAVLGAPLYLLSIVSNMYFLMGQEAGDIFMTRAFNSWPIGTPLTLFFMYCGAQTSMEAKNWEIYKDMAKLVDEHDQ